MLTVVGHDFNMCLTRFFSFPDFWETKKLCPACVEAVFVSDKAPRDMRAKRDMFGDLDGMIQETMFFGKYRDST